MARPGISDADLIARRLPREVARDFACEAARAASAPSGAWQSARADAAHGAVPAAVQCAALAVLDDRFRQLADALPHVVWVASADGRQLQFVNRAFDAVFGRDCQEVPNNPLACLRLIHPDDRKTVVRHVRQRGREGSVAGECRYIGSKGTVRWGRYQVLRVRDGSGGAPSWAGMFEDIHDEKCREEEFGKRREALAQAARLSSIGEMAANVTHEITQPLCAIGNLAAVCQLIVETHPQWNATELHRCLSLMSAEIARTRDIASRLRDFARRTATRRCTCDVNHILRESLALAAAELQLRNVAVAARIPSAAYPAQVDAIQITQVILNLLRNAADAMAELPEPSRRVEVASELCEGVIRVMIADDGPLVGAQHYGDWFRAFQSTKPNGLGLGLNICRSLVEDHGGRLLCEPNTPRGTKVTFTLPLRRQPNEP